MKTHLFSLLLFYTRSCRNIESIPEDLGTRQGKPSKGRQSITGYNHAHIPTYIHTHKTFTHHVKLTTRVFG